MTNNDVPNSRQSLKTGDKMTRDDIERIAADAGIVIFSEAGLKLCTLVAAAEREACCSIVYGQCGSDNVAQRTVDAIRARGEK